MNRKDFRPTSENYHMSDKDRALIRKEHNSKRKSSIKYRVTYSHRYATPFGLTDDINTTIHTKTFDDKESAERFKRNMNKKGSYWNGYNEHARIERIRVEERKKSAPKHHRKNSVPKHHIKKTTHKKVKKSGNYVATDIYGRPKVGASAFYRRI